MTRHKIDWYFILAYSPWYGWVYERLNDLVKDCLLKAIGTSLVDYIVLETALKKIADIINDRPLNYVSYEEVLRPLTPNNFLHPTRKQTRLVLEPLNLTSTSDTAKKLVQGYQRTLSMVEGYRQAFHSLYFSHLREV